MWPHLHGLYGMGHPGVVYCPHHSVYGHIPYGALVMSSILLLSPPLDPVTYAAVQVWLHTLVSMPVANTYCKAVKEAKAEFHIKEMGFTSGAEVPSP